MITDTKEKVLQM